MLKYFLSFEWKQFVRASYFQKGLAIKILLFLAVIYFGAIAIFLGIGLFFILKKLFPESDPLVLANNYLVYWLLFDLLIRYFLQQLPVMNIKPLMIIPVKRSTIIHYLLGKTLTSFFNFIPLFIFLPFTVVLISQDYNTFQVVVWFFGVMFLSLSNNFINFIINKSNTAFYIIAPVVLVLIGLEKYGIFKISEPAGKAFYTMFETPFYALVPVLIFVLLYKVNFTFIRKGFYLDDAVAKKIKEVQTADLSFLNRFGSMSTFLKNDIKLIWRNARPKQVLMMSFLFLFYGVIFYTQEIYMERPAIIAFASMFVTGGFLMTFGQLVPSWDSEYYNMLMSQNIPYKEYLRSKWLLMVFGVTISFILSTPYIYFGWDIYFMIFAGALFNIGLNSFITLFGGALNRVPIELNVKAKAFGNTNGFNPTQLLIGLPKVLLPMLLFYAPYKLLSFNWGLIILGLSGVVGLVFHNFFLNEIEKIYQRGKYKTIAAYNEKK